MITAFVRSIGVALALSTSLASFVAHAQSAEGGASTGESLEVVQARKHFNQGLKLYKDGDFDAALVQFERAYAVKPNYKVLYNIAQSYFELRQYVEARDTLTRYLKEGADGIDAERRTSVETDLAELQRRIAHLKVSVNVQGASVYVDGKKIGTTPLGDRFDVSEGQRTIAIETADRGSRQRVVRLAGGEEQSIEIKFEEAAAASSPGALGTGGPPPAPKSDRLGTGFWISGVSALVLGASAGVTGYLALKSAGEHDDQLGSFPVNKSELDASRDQAKTLALTTDILAGGAVLCAGIATVLFISHDSDARQVGVAVGPGQLSLRGKF